MERIFKEIEMNRRVLNTFECPTCGRDVDRVQITIPFGPKKGETVVMDDGCMCEIEKIVGDALLHRSQKMQQKLDDMFHERSLINESLRQASFATFDPYQDDLAEAKQFLETYAQDFDPETSANVLLVGPCGVGKSHLAMSAAKEVLSKGFKTVFLSVPKLLSKIKETYRHDAPASEQDVMHVVQTADCLVLDDLGAEYSQAKGSGDNWAQAKLFEILDHRAGRPTILTTNLSSQMLAHKAGERNFSRIMDQATVIRLDSQDYRKGRIDYV
ncbi:DNA replication protein DnaC [Alkalibacillus flavidus]|uniref:DNA replication protein DnaC n=1 Tax=Alkalibacillus flavidus TaxID=546021 RepID=A0ABV2KXN0_9BACI